MVRQRETVNLATRGFAQIIRLSDGGSTDGHSETENSGTEQLLSALSLTRYQRITAAQRRDDLNSSRHSEVNHVAGKSVNSLFDRFTQSRVCVDVTRHFVNSQIPLLGECQLRQQLSDIRADHVAAQ
jgi:hypothetical protein